ncbi:MAG: phage integrase N-terminal SAM-like domain-containing protein, partial [Halodesulfurarchaeum sp.]
MSDFDDITVVPNPTEELLNERQVVDYRAHREACIEWLLTFGKNPDTADGYAHSTVKYRSFRMDQFYRWVWNHDGRYTTDVTHDHADAYLRHLAKQDASNAHKNNCLKALKMLFKWRQHAHGLDEWEPQLSFSTTHGATTPRDYLTESERAKIREAALEY